MRTNESTLVALDTLFSFPNRNECRNTALFVSRSSLGPGTVFNTLECAHGEEVTVLGGDGTHDIGDEFGLVLGLCHISGELCPCRIYNEFLIFTAAVDGSIVLVDHILSLLAVGLHDKVLHLLNGLFYRNHTGDAEECALQNGVGAVSESDFLGNLGGIDVVALHLLLGKHTLHIVGQVGSKFLAFPDGVEQEGSTLLDATEDIVHVEVSLYVASHKVRCGYKIGGADGGVTETEVRAGETSRLLGVVGEVSLAILVGCLTDNLDGVLVGTHSTVGTETIELGLEHAFATEGNLFLLGERGEGNIVDDADGEVVLRLGKCKVLVNGENLCGSGIVGAEAITSADNLGSVGLSVEGFLDIEVEGLSVCTGFLGTVEHSNALAGLGDSGKEVLGAEGTVEVNADESDLFALCGKMVDGLASGFGSATHEHNDAVGILGTIVAEELVTAAGDFANLMHIFFHNLGNALVVGVAAFAMCEECVGVLCHTACNGTFGGEGTLTECSKCFLVNQRRELLGLEHLNLLDFVRSTESVEEVNERHTALDGCEVCHTCEVHNLLNATFGQHGETGLAGRHDVLMVAEDAEAVAGKRTCRNMEYAGKEFTCYLVHVGNHEKQAL